MIRIFLIGYMGAGKSTLGKTLAQKMKLTFIDTDCFIENRYHRKISDIFATDGEEYFRILERRILQEVSEYEDVIISTGGGLPCFFDNMEIMNKAGITVYLKTSVSELAARLRTSKTARPILKHHTGDDLAKFIAENLDKRREFYEKSRICFDSEVMRDDDDVSTLAAKLEKLITDLS